MGNQRPIQISKVEKLKNIAFWQWEYLRRNPLYRRYCDVINYYYGYFESLGELDYMHTKEFMELCNQVFNEGDAFDWESSEFFNRIDEKDEENGLKYCIKFAFLCKSYANRFFRLYKHYSFGETSDNLLETAIKKDNNLFQSEDYGDILSVLHLCNWILQCEFGNPDLITIYFQSPLSLDPKQVSGYQDSKKVGMESSTVQVANLACENIFDEQEIDEKLLEDVYDFALNRKYINTADELRLACLWMWDEFDAGCDDEDAEFERVLKELRAKIKDAEMGGYRPWDQVIKRKKRMFDYLIMTDQCIQQHAVFPLNSR